MGSDRPDSSNFPLTRNTTAATDSGTTRRAGARKVPTRANRFWRSVRLCVSGILCLGAAIAGTFIGNIYFHSKTGHDLIIKVAHSVIFNGGDPLAEFTIEKQ